MDFVFSLFQTYRRLASLICLCATSMVVISFGLEYFLKLEPCPLCIVQRWIFIAITLTSLVSLMPLKIIDMAFHIMSMLLLNVGQFVSARHIYLTWQSPDTVQSCGLSLEFMVENLPWKEIASLLFHGSGSCNKIDWAFLGLSLPTWAFIHFTTMWLLAIIAVWRYLKR